MLAWLCGTLVLWVCRCNEQAKVACAEALGPPSSVLSRAIPLADAKRERAFGVVRLRCGGSCPHPVWDDPNFVPIILGVVFKNAHLEIFPDLFYHHFTSFRDSRMFTSSKLVIKFYGLDVRSRV